MLFQIPVKIFRDAHAGLRFQKGNDDSCVALVAAIS